MQDSQSGELTQQQQSRLALIQTDLDAARDANLGSENAATLILYVERLRSSLHDAVTLVHELSESAGHEYTSCSSAISDHGQ